MNIVVKCLSADGMVLGSKQVELFARNGQGFPTRQVVVPIAIAGTLDMVEAYVTDADLDVRIPMKQWSGPVPLKPGDTVTMVLDGPLIRWSDLHS